MSAADRESCSSEAREFISALASTGLDDESPDKNMAWNGDGVRESIIDNSRSPPPLSGVRQSIDPTRQLSSDSRSARSDSDASSNSIENVVLETADETRVENALINADKKQTTGSVFSVRVDMGEAEGGALGIGVKDLSGGVLVVSMLKRKDEKPGPGERAGLRLGDVIFGINFLPSRLGAQSLIKTITAMKVNYAKAVGEAATSEADDAEGEAIHKLKEARRNSRYIHLQCWRCHQLCVDAAPGFHFPRTDDVVIKAYAFHRNKILSDWERWNFFEIVLSYMLKDARERAGMTTRNGFTAFDRQVGSRLSVHRSEKLLQMNVMDLERNLLLAKCLRKALCVRIVHTKPTTQQDTVVYVLRVEDVETGLQWVAHRRYRDFFALNEELNEMSGYVRDIEFPQKRLVSKSSKVVESRVVLLEQYLRQVLHLLNLYATMDPVASRSLRHVQKFLRVDVYIDCMYPPPVDDQRYIELLAFQFLNDFGSPACQQCMRFVNNVDLESLVQHGQPEGYRPMLQHLSQALTEVEQFVLQHHHQQMHAELKERRPEMSVDQISTFVRRCVRRQVEAALFLPLRRSVVKQVFSFMSPNAQEMQLSLKSLHGASTDYFMVNSTAPRARALTKAIHKFREVTRAYLPADQGQLLMHAAAAVMELHTECVSLQQQEQRQKAEQLRRLQEAGSKDETGPIDDFGDIAQVSSGSASDDGEEDATADPSGEWDREHGSGGLSSNPSTGEGEGEVLPSKGPSLSRRHSAGPTVLTTTTASQKESKGLLFNVPTPPDSMTPLKSTHKSGGKLESSSSSAGTSAAAEASSQLLSRRASMGTLPASLTLRTSNSAPHFPITSGMEGRNSCSSTTAVSSKKLKEYDLLSNATLADPIYAIFESRETMPARILYGDYTRSRPAAGVQHDLSMLAYSEEEEEGGEDAEVKEMENNSLPPMTPTSPSVDQAALWHNRSPRAGTFSPSIDASLTSPNTSAKLRANSIDFPPKSVKARALSFSPEEGLELATTAERLQNDRMSPHRHEDEGNSRGSEATNTAAYYESHAQNAAVSADDFLPMFTYVLVQANLPHLLVVKELMTSLVDDEETYGECGYYLATLEAALRHIGDLAAEYKKEQAEGKGGK